MKCARLVLFFSVLFIASKGVDAQTATSSCELGMASADLESDDLRARVYNGGNLFLGPANFGDSREEAQYVVPRQEGISPIYSASFVIGGRVGGELRTAARQYHDFEFWPGPLDESGRPPEDCGTFDRIYAVSRDDVALLHCPALPDSQRVDWPYELGAPIVDGDGIESNYDVQAGDRPALLGDRMTWWVMNDAGNDHGATGTPPLGMEVRGSAFLFRGQHGSLPDSPAAHHLRHATFYRFEFTYRGAQPLEDAYVGLFVDPDVGSASDDFTGTDTTLGLAYAYNASNDDPLYGSPPPAVGVAVLRGPVGLDGEPLGMEASGRIWKGLGEYGDPTHAAEYYDAMRGLFPNGDSMRYGGMGFDVDGETTVFQYPGDPVGGEFWSELNIDGQGTANSPGDRKLHNYEWAVPHGAR